MMIEVLPGAEREAEIDDDLALARARSLHLLRTESSAVPGGIVCTISGLAVVWWLFSGRVEPILFGAWLAYMTGVIIALSVAYVVAQLRQPREDAYLGFWGPLGRSLNFAIVLGTVASVWILMPVADEASRFVLVMIYVWFVVVQLLVHGEGVRLLTTSAIIGVFGSLVFYLIINPMNDGYALAAVLVLMAVTIIGLQGTFRTAIRDAIDARVLSDSLTQARDGALATVIVERDAKTRFLESASHDLRQPLQAARMFLDQVQRGKAGPQREQAIDRLHWALDATDRSLTQILEYLRLDAGEVKADCRSFAIGPLLAHLASFNEPHCEVAQTAIIAMPSKLRVFADPALVERALGNFIGNALRHARAERILIGARAVNGAVRIWVIDDGVGTASRDRATLFDDYIQGSDHGDALRGGFGLGLASVRRLATLMNGAAGLDPRWTNGSAFWLELPTRTV